MRPPDLLSRGDLRRMGRRLRRWLTPTDRRPQANLHVCSPLVLPDHHRAAVRNLNAAVLRAQIRRRLARHSMVDPILWVYLPNDLILQVAGGLRHTLLVYDCVDAIAEFRHAPPALAASEGRLLDQADLVFASSRRLLERCRRHQRSAHYVANAADVDWFARESRRAPEPLELAALPRPRVGYVGAVREWFDLDLLEAAARRFPAVHFVLIGDRPPGARRRQLPNLLVLGPRPYDTLPRYLGALDVAIIPFRDTELVRSTHPIKVYEYLAAGLPVVSTPMEEIRHLREVDMASSGEPFLEALGRRISRPEAPADGERRRRSVARETWDERFTAVDRALGEALAAQRRGRR